jgi:uncharacterized protein YajQ (UPF0234 family)
LAAFDLTTEAKTVETRNPVELAEREISFGEYTFEVPSMEFSKS